MRPILSASGTYNFPLAKWLEEKLKPLSTNKYCINDIFSFTDEIKNTRIESDHILVSYDVSALFTNVPLKETIDILVDKAFEDDWFNKTHSMQLQKHQLTELLEIATSNQLFQFNGELYEQTDGVAMGSPLGPLLANVFMCHIENQLEQNNMIPSFYRRYVDDTLVKVPNTEAAINFLQVLNGAHPSLSFTMELEHEGSIPFLGTLITRNDNTLKTEVYRKPTDTGLLLHFQSHVDNRYKKGLVNTMVDRAHRLSSTEEAFTKECNKLRTMFSKLHYPNALVDSTIRKFRQETNTEPHAATPSEPSVYISLPFKDQRSANRVRKEIHSLGSKINIDVKPVFTSRKLSQILCVKENKPPIVNTQCVVYLFKCDLCDANYVGFTAQNLHQRISEHRYSAIGKHLEAQHGSKGAKINHLFRVLKKCRSKFDCLVYEMLFIRDINPSLNTQSDSIRAKLFT
ncbi:uncharacterized protein LOC144650432 [Oculina patagonica]